MTKLRIMHERIPSIVNLSLSTARDDCQFFVGSIGVLCNSKFRPLEFQMAPIDLTNSKKIYKVSMFALACLNAERVYKDQLGNALRRANCYFSRYPATDRSSDHIDFFE